MSFAIHPFGVINLPNKYIWYDTFMSLVNGYSDEYDLKNIINFIYMCTSISYFVFF